MPTVLRVRSRVGRRMNSFFCCARKNVGRLRVQAVIRAIVCSATWSAKAARGAGDDDLGLDHRRHQAVIHAGGRGLDPLQPSLADDAVPIDRHFGVTAEDVGREDFRGDLLLGGIDDLGLRHDGGDLLQVTGLGDVAENDCAVPLLSVSNALRKAVCLCPRQRPPSRLRNDANPCELRCRAVPSSTQYTVLNSLLRTRRFVLGTAVSPTLACALGTAYGVLCTPAR